MADNPWEYSHKAADPFAGIPDALKPNPPAAMPGPQEIPSAVAASPFSEPLDIDEIFKNLDLNRPLSLFIPRRIMERFSEIEFRIINSIPAEIAAAKNKGFREVTDPETSALFQNLVAGTDKLGAAYRPLLYGRPKVVGEHVRKQHRKQLASIYAGMDPKNREFQSGYAKNEIAVSEGAFKGPAFRIKV